MDQPAVRAAARAIETADAIVVTAGAGIGVDSGLPDFRGDEGFWNAYPPYRRLGRSFLDMANPATFRTDPAFAWGFYGHRRALYRATAPHAGFEVLADWIADAPLGGFVVTSNVDGHFHEADIDPDAIWEVHGTLRYDQCLAACGAPPFAAGSDVEVDEATMRAVERRSEPGVDRGSEPGVEPLPACPTCGGLARPNVLMFGDGDFDPSISDAQARRFHQFLDAVDGHQLVVVESGAGTGLPTIRRLGEQVAARYGAPLVRINPREPQGPAGTISLAAGARDALLAVADVRD